MPEALAALTRALSRPVGMAASESPSLACTPTCASSVRTLAVATTMDRSFRGAFLWGRGRGGGGFAKG
eukprot:8883465-Alexandrium_andersonii.AAC.1